MRDLDNIFLEQRIHELEKNGTGGGSSADKISYNNIESGLTSNTVQGAIDEVHEEVENIKHHYSTEEKIIGEWIDGTPIYEKVTSVNFGIPSTSAFTLNGFNTEYYGTIIYCAMLRGIGALNPLTVWKDTTYLRAKAFDTLDYVEGDTYIIMHYTKNE